MERKNSNRFIHSTLLIPKPDCRFCIITHRISSRIDEKQCDLHRNLQCLLEQEMFHVLNILRQYNAERAKEAHLP